MKLITMKKDGREVIVEEGSVLETRLAEKGFAVSDAQAVVEPGQGELPTKSRQSAVDKAKANKKAAADLAARNAEAVKAQAAANADAEQKKAADEAAKAVAAADAAAKAAEAAKAADAAAKAAEAAKK